MQLVGGEFGAAVEAERGAHVADFLGDQEPADQLLAVVGSEPADAEVLVGQPVPDRQEEAGDDPEAGFGVARERRDLVVPEPAPFRFGGALPMGGGECLGVDRLAVVRTHQPVALLYVAVVEDANRGGENDRRAPGAGVDDQLGFVV